MTEKNDTQSIILLSYPLSEETPLYGNGKGIELKPDKQQCIGDSCNTMKFPNHAGTHIDTPRHFSETGKCITDFPPEFWIFNKVEVADVSGKIKDNQLITVEILPDFHHEEPELLLIKTGYGKFRGTDRYTITPPGVSSDIAYFLREKYPSVRSIGMDLISVSSFSNRDEGRLAHREFLCPDNGESILIIEDMKLDFQGFLKKVLISPIFVTDGDGSPVTVLALCAN